MNTVKWFGWCLVCGWIATSIGVAEERLPDRVSLVSGDINHVLVEGDGERLAIYGARSDLGARVDQLLVTHHRRDVLSSARRMAASGVPVVAPLREQYWFESPVEFWASYATGRFHDYSQYTTKILARPLPVSRWVKQGDVVSWNGIDFRVLETPGYTRGGISYVATIDGKTIAFTGELIYEGGRIIDLYSFQDAIPAAQIRGYHGYGSRLAELVSSLKKVAAEKPDIIVPIRGPVIQEPLADIETLIGRVQALYRNYLSTNALHWYFKEDRMRICGERVLGAGAEIELMPYCHHEPAPSWVFEHSTSRLLISKTKRGFLLDCGYQRVIDAINKLIDDGVIEGVDGIFVTHYHDDHTDAVQAAATEFNCPVYATTEYQDVLQRPGGYHLPALSANAIEDVKGVKDGHVMKWHEFELTFRFFPGQTYYHGALLAKKPDERPIFFIGDAFAPSGLDDYCVLNRNLVHGDSGYQYCFSLLRQIDEPYWLVNEHIPYVFSFSDDEMDYLETRYRERVRLLGELFPWDDPNYGIDEQWAVMYPFGSRCKPGETIDLEVRLTNHSPEARQFTIVAHTDESITIAESSPQQIELASRGNGRIAVRAVAPDEPGVYLVTADVQSSGMRFSDWVEAMIIVE